jgi:hypothetical protein
MHVPKGTIIGDAITEALKQREKLGDTDLVFEFNGTEYIVTSTVQEAYETVTTKWGIHQYFM